MGYVGSSSEWASLPKGRQPSGVAPPQNCLRRIPNGATMVGVVARPHAALSCPLLGLLGVVDTRRLVTTSDGQNTIHATLAVATEAALKFAIGGNRC